METEMKDRKQLDEIAKYISKKIKRKILGIKCIRDVYDPEDKKQIRILTQDNLELRMYAYKDEKRLNRDINKVCRDYIRAKEEVVSNG